MPHYATINSAFNLIFPGFLVVEDPGSLFWTFLITPPDCWLRVDRPDRYQEERQPDDQVQKELHRLTVPHLQLALPEALLVAIVAARQHALKPTIQNDEQIARAYLLDAHLRDAFFAVLPRVWQHCVPVAADNVLI
jgi:hypothetical protein